MDEQNQIVIPPSFLAIYSRNGRPIATRSDIEERYDLCEDLASQTSDVCHTLQFKEDLSENEVLVRCHRSLNASAVVSPAESVWVITRVAELLQWRSPQGLGVDDAGP